MNMRPTTERLTDVDLDQYEALAMAQEDVIIPGAELLSLIAEAKALRAPVGGDARSFIDSLDVKDLDDDRTKERLASLLTRISKSARDAETEECAKVAEDERLAKRKGAYHCARVIATAIRARIGKGEGWAESFKLPGNLSQPKDKQDR